MLFQVRMDINIPLNEDINKVNEMKVAEKVYGQSLQRSGKWLHIWRVTGQYANISIFDVADNEELHQILLNLPLYRYMTIEIVPLNQHPSKI